MSGQEIPESLASLSTWAEAHAPLGLTQARLVLELLRMVPIWQPIETAPKDGTKILVRYADWGNNKKVIIACWHDDRFNKKPRPYWDLQGFRVQASRSCQPDAWMPLPSVEGP